MEEKNDLELLSQLLSGVETLLTEPLNPDSPLRLMMQYWGPPLITIILGGVFASILLPGWQEAQARARVIAEHRAKLTESLASAFARYITAWRRLIDISYLGQQRPLSDAETSRRDQFVIDRNAARDELLDLCARGQLYFSDGVAAMISEFVAWDTSQAAKSLDSLPKIEEWRKWETRILTRLRKDHFARRFRR
ncbi:MAG: hypothetical protein AAGF46_07515 [Pseudomonadota bacterium]